MTIYLIICWTGVLQDTNMVQMSMPNTVFKSLVYANAGK